MCEPSPRDRQADHFIDLLREAEWKLDVLYLESAPVRYSIDRRDGATLPGEAEIGRKC